MTSTTRTLVAARLGVVRVADAGWFAKVAADVKREVTESGS
jgi:hypothetical protein